MKRRILSTFLLSFTLVLSSSFSVFGQNSPNYVLVKVGIYDPTGDLDDIGLGTGQNVEISFGHYFNPGFALEGNIGYFKTDETFSGFDPMILGFFSEKDEVSVIPITVTAKGINSFGTGELYLGGGIGLYLAEFDADITSSTLGSGSLSDEDTILGFHLLAGLNFNVSDKWFIGIEGKYIITSDGKARGVVFGIPITLEEDLDGFFLTGILGFRF